MEKIKNNLGKIIKLTSMTASVFLVLTLFSMFDMYEIDYVELLALALAITSCVLLIVFAFKNVEIKKYLLLPFSFFIASFSIVDLNALLDSVTGLNVFPLLLDIAILVFFILIIVKGKQIFKDILLSLLAALTITHLIASLNMLITSVSYVMLSVLFILCFMLYQKDEAQPTVEIENNN